MVTVSISVVKTERCRCGRIAVREVLGGWQKRKGKERKKPCRCVHADPKLASTITVILPLARIFCLLYLAGPVWLSGSPRTRTRQDHDTTSRRRDTTLPCCPLLTLCYSRPVIHRGHLAGRRQTRLTLHHLSRLCINFLLAVWESKSGNTAAAKCCAVTSPASFNGHASRPRSGLLTITGATVTSHTSLTLLLFLSLGLLGLPGSAQRFVWPWYAGPKGRPRTGTARRAHGCAAVTSWFW